ncbi:MAG: S8 family serine peptidase [Gemmatimonadaceae bacterium]
MPKARLRPYTGRIIVRLTPHVVRDLLAVTPLVLANTWPRSLVEVAQRLGPANVEGALDLLAAVLGLESDCAVPWSMVPQVAEREALVASQGYTRRSLLSYFIVDARSLSSERARRLRALKFLRVSNRLIDQAHLEPNLREATWAVTPDDETFGDDEQHLLAEHVDEMTPRRGIDCNSQYVWGAFSGAGVGFVDFETAWKLEHPDLPDATGGAQPMYGKDGAAAYPYAVEHGANVLGVVVGRDNGMGVVGIAPGANFRGVISRVTAYNEPPLADNLWDVTGALSKAMVIMAAGDVLLIELETIVATVPEHPSFPTLIRGMPIEAVDLWSDAIRLVVDLGIIVIEAAGNGDSGATPPAYDLDTLKLIWSNVPESRTLNRTPPSGTTFLDSGAVLVGACNSWIDPSDGNRRADFSSYGSRIDCYAWGDHVFTTATYSGDPPTGSDKYYGYHNGFNGTSAAAAMIAGAALLIQEMHLATLGRVATPAEMRDILSSLDNGTPVYPPAGDVSEGVMPDLSRIAQQLGAVPDVYVRDDVNDDGLVPNAVVSASPDIVLKQIALANPDAAIGAGSAIADAMVPNDDVLPDNPNFLYVRVRNRGPVAAKDVTATVYWAEAAVYVPPQEWHKIGTTSPFDVGASPFAAASPSLTVSPPIVWTPSSGATPAELPAKHGCFIALLDSPADPRPVAIPVSGAASWADFLSIIGAHNNLAFRNFIVAGTTLSMQALQRAEFLLHPSGSGRRLDITIEIRGGTGLQWSLDLPSGLARALHLTTGATRRKVGKVTRVIVPLTATTVHLTGKLPISKTGTPHCAVEVKGTRGVQSTPAYCRIQQSFDGVVLGCLTIAVTT